MLVIVKHTGNCGGYSYKAGQEVDLPEDVLKALGAQNYEVQEVQIKDTSLPVQSTTAMHPKKKTSK